MRGALKESLKSWPLSFPYLKPHRGKVVVSMALMAVGSAVALLEPWPLALLVDSVLGEKPLPGPLELLSENVATQVATVMALMLGVTLAGSGIAALTDYVNTKIEMKMVLDFRSDLFQHVQRLSFDYHDDRRTGEFMGRINGQASSVGSVTVAAFPLVGSLLTLIGMFAVAYRLNPPVALLSLSVVPFIYYTTGYYGAKIGPEVRKVKGMEIRSLHIVHEAVQMIRVIVAFNREKDEYEKFRKQGEEAVDARIKVTVKQTSFNGVVGLITAAGTAAVLGLGAYQVRQGNLSTGQLLVLLAYIRAVYTPLETISATMNSIQEQLIGFEMSLELLETQPDVVEKPGAIEIAKVRGAVSFENVSFNYEGREHTLQDISFHVDPGTSVAIVGPTGAGKTTLVSLLPRFYDPAGGRILVDGVDIRDLTLASLRGQISLVLQEPLLFSGTIEDNIRYGRPEATKEEIIAAAKAANAHDFIRELPRKYRTKLGERGAKLSGGERQRLSVARAFLKDAPILVLDEPTSSIDSRTEAVILEALGRLMEGRTTFMVAHRLSTIQNARQILVIDQGKLVESGTHEELLAQNGLYRLLDDAQTGRDVGFFTPALHAMTAEIAEAACVEAPQNGRPTLDSTVAALRALGSDAAPERTEAAAGPARPRRPRRTQPLVARTPPEAVLPALVAPTTPTMTAEIAEAACVEAPQNGRPTLDSTVAALRALGSDAAPERTEAAADPARPRRPRRTQPLVARTPPEAVLPVPVAPTTPTPPPAPTPAPPPPPAVPPVPSVPSLIDTDTDTGHQQNGKREPAVGSLAQLVDLKRVRPGLTKAVTNLRTQVEGSKSAKDLVKVAGAGRERLTRVAEQVKARSGGRR